MTADIRVLDGAHLAALGRFETIIDVRSPAEYAEDHLPGAVNLPVLTDAERAEVGTIYVQDSRLKANRIGAAYVARNIARHLESALADKAQGFAPLIYCWRGGQRSNAMATILARIGWRPCVLEGGYKTYRRTVREALYERPWPAPVVLLDGDTGSAKTEVLGRLAAHGLQTVDLEDLAGHRGSLLGGWADRPQPSQKQFESGLWAALQGLDPGRPVVVEAESSKIGERIVPPALWQAMLAAPRIELSAPAETRALYLTRAYGDLTRDPQRFAVQLGRLEPHIGRERAKAWRAMLEAGDIQALALAMVIEHYDPAYARSRRKDVPVAVIGAPDLDPAGQDAAAAAVAAAVNAARNPPG